MPRNSVLELLAYATLVTLLAAPAAASDEGSKVAAR